MRCRKSTIITLLAIFFLLGAVYAQIENSFIYFSSDLEVGYEYIWDEIKYTSPTFLSDGITEEHNITIKILKEIDLDIETLEKEGEILVEGWSITDSAYDYFLYSYDGIIMTKDMVIHPEDYNTSIFIISVLTISQYMFPVEVVEPNGEKYNQFDILAENFTLVPDAEYVVDGEEVTYKHATGGNTISEYTEKQWEYSTGLLLFSNDSIYGELGLISQTIISLRNQNVRTEYYTNQGQSSQIPADGTEIGFLSPPPTWVSNIGIIAVFGIIKRNKWKN